MRKRNLAFGDLAMVIPPSVLNVFASSPIRPLQAHMDKVYAGVQVLAPLFAAVAADDWDKAAVLHEEISALECGADELKRQLRLQLHKGLFLSFSRADVLELVTVQDLLVNRAEDIAGLIMGRRMQFPGDLQTALTQLVAACVAAVGQAHQAITELEEVLLSGFSGNAVQVVETLVSELNKAERETDEQQHALRAQLFAKEADYPPVSVVFMYKTLEWIGDLADQAQRVGNRLQILMAR